ncbi:MAG: hypothetical protein IKG85_00710 [Clostridia bacterium]|nr:hypothetical protein [Clostridia bacterium]
MLDPEANGGNDPAISEEAPVITEATTEQPEAVVPLHMVTEIADGAIDGIRALIGSFKTAEPDTTSSLERVPVYYEEDLIGKAAVMTLDYTREACLYYGSGSMGALQETLACYPGAAFRKCSDDRGYLVYDTETGYRVFILTDKQHGYGVRVGLPLIVKQALRYDDFKALKIGDTIDDVCAVDPAGELYRGIFSNYAEYPDPLAFNDENEFGYYHSSVHYLSDGILKIEYVMSEDHTIEIRNIIYSEDYILPDAEGYPVNYRILDVDLP